MFYAYTRRTNPGKVVLGFRASGFGALGFCLEFRVFNGVVRVLSWEAPLKKMHQPVALLWSTVLGFPMVSGYCNGLGMFRFEGIPVL